METASGCTPHQNSTWCITYEPCPIGEYHCYTTCWCSEVSGNIPLGPAALTVYIPKNLLHWWYITDIHLLAMIYIFHSMSVMFWATVAPPPPPPPEIQNGITVPAYRVQTHGAQTVRGLVESDTEFLSRKAYYSCQVSRICVAAVSVETRALKTDGTIDQMNRALMS